MLSRAMPRLPALLGPKPIGATLGLAVLVTGMTATFTTSAVIGLLTRVVALAFRQD